MKSIGLIVFAILFFHNIYARKDSINDKNFKFSLSVLIGRSSGFNQTQDYSNDITEIISVFTNNKNGIIHGISMSYLFYKNVGASINIERNKYALTYSILFHKSYPYSFTETYPDYYVYDLINNYSNYHYFHINLYFGLFYRIRWKRFSLEPTAFIGLTRFKPPYQDITLKQKGSNYSKMMYYEGQTVLSFNPRLGIKLKYRIYNTTELQLNYEYSRIEPNVKYKIETVDVYGKQEFETIQKRQVMELQHITVGINYYFNLPKKKTLPNEVQSE